ncbi:MAG: 3-isopropylmalate/(R)-2-methylmalate dehydratase small subunit [Methanothermococcus sp.]|jgi:3-isopropylmalate/(R)-2-methylmalate dehydratase small subunit|uniref:3-isopropylmalate dehydratase small subunit n=1 Tax=Methanothermococcus TaxID=155862 RepID=UPI00036D01D5|nr:MULTISPECIES: 3-isopropylmalate dehydratase small subunit [Methanothermococcus]MDK2790733.1 3-isopropylmalate/(R)-2-methylmalate dehydratase small subunit [Methanothermococcus sp.]
MEKVVKGKAWVFGDNIDTDAILPARYLVYTTEEELAKYAMTGTDPEFPEKAQKGDIIVGGKNFGCGSSREHAPIGLKGLGISLVIAESFARIFYRNSINIGLPLLECKDISKHVSEGDILEVDLDSGVIKNLTTGVELKGQKLPEFMMEILNDGGLMPHLKKKLKS